MEKYIYKVVEMKPNETNSEANFTAAINAGADGGWQFVTIENQNNKFYAIYQKLQNVIV